MEDSILVGYNYVFAGCFNYYGQVLDEKAHGKGIMIVHNNDTGKDIKLDGEWASGEFVSGEMYKGNETFRGKFRKGLLQGTGLYIVNKENEVTLRESNYVDGVGFGPSKTWINGKLTFDGMKVGGKAISGTLYYDVGSYTGQMINGKAYGKGIYKDDSYEHSGEFADEMAHGYGTRVYKNGNKYEGNFIDEEFSGKGTFTFTDGQVVSGIFVYDKSHDCSYVEQDSGKFYPIEYTVDGYVHQKVVKIGEKWTCACCTNKPEI